MEGRATVPVTFYIEKIKELLSKNKSKAYHYQELSVSLGMSVKATRNLVRILKREGVVDTRPLKATRRIRCGYTKAKEGQVGVNHRPKFADKEMMVGYVNINAGWLANNPPVSPAA